MNTHTDAITKVSLRGVPRFAGLRSNLAVRDEIAALVYPEELEGFAMTILTILNAHVLDSGKDSIMN